MSVAPRSTMRRIAISFVGLGAMAVGCVRVASPTSEASAAPVLPLTTAGGVEAILVPGGSFLMGVAGGVADESPPHEVEVAAFVMDRHEVLQGALAELARPNPSQFKGDRRPVEMYRWADAAEFCNARSEAEGLEPCYDLDTFECDFGASGYRLPTEAEWEYACRSGGEAVSPGTPRPAELAERACYAVNSGGATRDAGARAPNRWGFHDMLGNVSEWCHDRYAADWYGRSPRAQPRGPDEGRHRVLRGGSWQSSADDCRPTRRLHDEPGTHDACFAQNTYGFRCVRRPTADELARLAALAPEASG